MTDPTAAQIRYAHLACHALVEWADEHEQSGAPFDLASLAHPLHLARAFGVDCLDVNEANARLIAAAPELLSACEHLVAACEILAVEGPSPSGREVSDYLESVLMAHRAIRHATVATVADIPQDADPAGAARMACRELVEWCDESERTGAPARFSELDATVTLARAAIAKATGE